MSVNLESLPWVEGPPTHKNSRWGPQSRFEQLFQPADCGAASALRAAILLDAGAGPERLSLEGVALRPAHRGNGCGPHTAGSVAGSKTRLLAQPP